MHIMLFIDRQLFTILENLHLKYVLKLQTTLLQILYVFNGPIILTKCDTAFCWKVWSPVCDLLVKATLKG